MNFLLTIALSNDLFITSCIDAEQPEYIFTITHNSAELCSSSWSYSAQYRQHTVSDVLQIACLTRIWLTLQRALRAHCGNVLQIILRICEWFFFLIYLHLFATYHHRLVILLNTQACDVQVLKFKKCRFRVTKIYVNQFFGYQTPGGLKPGAVSIWRCRLTSIAIPMLRIRRSRDRLIFNMGIPIPGEDGLHIETGIRFICIDWLSIVSTHNWHM